MDTKTSTTKPTSRLSKRASISFALTIVVILGVAASAAAQEKSKGVYRIPFEDGVTVKVTNDHLKHSPPGRIDMHGEGGSKPYKIVAAADGRIRFIVDNFSKQIDSSSGEPCTNNYVWIEHANGEWTKYSHMQKDSVTKKAKLKVGQFVKSRSACPERTTRSRRPEAF
jgi:murein DD-endopeptidase MepM/ murein hydrolase activator NlpD